MNRDLTHSNTPNLKYLNVSSAQFNRSQSADLFLILDHERLIADFSAKSRLLANFEAQFMAKATKTLPLLFIAQLNLLIEYLCRS